MGKNVIIGGRIHNPEVGNVALGANEVLDDTKGKKQNVINTETDAELLRLENEKQDNLSFDDTPTENSTNPITSGGVYASELLIHQAIEMILALIPSAASALNQLADKSFVNSTVATATATFRGTYNVVTDLGLAFDATHEQIAAALLSHIATADNNDYAFVQIPVSETSTDIRVTERYKFNGTAWAYEYDLNNSGFTAAQWAAINSGITALLVEKLGALPTAAELALALSGKQATLTFDNAPVAGSNNPVKSGGLYELFTAIDAKMPAGASASNKLVAEDRLASYVSAIIGALDASYNVTSSDGHVTVKVTQVDGSITNVEVLTNDIASASALNTLTGRVSANESDLAGLHVQVDALTGQKYVTVTATAGTTSPTDVLPSSGQATDTIYRIGSWDGTQYDPNTYSEYSWDGTDYQFLDNKNVGIDTVPTAGSTNLVESGGVFKQIGFYKIDWKENSYVDKDTGEVIDYPLGGFLSSDLIFIVQGYKYFLTGMVTTGSVVNAISFYDAEKKYISGIHYDVPYEYDNWEINVPQDAAYLRLCMSSEYELTLSTDNASYAYSKKMSFDVLKNSESINAVANYDTDYVYEKKVGTLFSSSSLLDQGNYTVNGVVFNASNKFKKLTIGCGQTNQLDVKIVKMDTVSVLETITKSGTAGENIIVLPSDFQFDFNANTDTVGIFVENHNLGSEDSKRVVPFASSATNDLLSFVDGSTNMTSAPYKPSMQFEMDVMLPIMQEIEDLKGDNPANGDLQSYINSNKNVQLRAGTYYIDTPLTIPNGTKISGVRGSTIIKLRNATSCISINAGEDIEIENITFEGLAAVNPASITVDSIKNRTNDGTKTGIYMTGAVKSIFINNCRFKNFDLAGIRAYRTEGDLTECYKVTDCIFEHNWYGFLSDIRSEYNTVVGCSFNSNQIGCFVAGGNNYFSCCHFDKNGVGCVVSGTGGDNDSHGVIAGSSFNHNTVFSLCCIDINNGFTFIGCNIFDGNIIIQNSKAILYDGGVIAAEIVQNLPASGQVSMVSNCMFHKTYGGGTISDNTNLLLKNNHFVDGSDSSSINN